MKRVIGKSMFRVTLGHYSYSRVELEARLAQFIFLIAYGYSETEVTGTEEIHKKFLGRVEKDRGVYIDGLREQEEKYKQVQRLGTDKDGVIQIEKNIDNLKKRIWEMEQFENDYSYLLEEARRIGLKLKEKREAILNQVKD